MSIWWVKILKHTLKKIKRVMLMHASFSLHSRVAWRNAWMMPFMFWGITLRVSCLFQECLDIQVGLQDIQQGLTQECHRWCPPHIPMASWDLLLHIPHYWVAIWSPTWWAVFHNLNQILHSASFLAIHGMCRLTYTYKCVRVHSVECIFYVREHARFWINN